MTSQNTDHTPHRGDEKTDPASFEIIARTIFAPVYPVIASQIIEATGITSGFCLDIGCGGGHLGMAVAKFGNFERIGPEAVEGFRENLNNAEIDKFTITQSEDKGLWIIISKGKRWGAVV